MAASLNLLATLTTLALAVMLLIAITNALLFPRLMRVSPPLCGLPAVSVLIPARNEAARIGRTMAHILEQDYAAFELIVLDDGSDDGTARVAAATAAGDPRVRILPGQAMPPGWSGKNWACHQLAQAARHNYLLFTDADVVWHHGALAAVVHEAITCHADLLTVWPTQQTVTWGERLTVPLMALAVWAYLPVWLVHHTAAPYAAAANGQCLLFRRAAYCQIGGHLALRNQVIEDVVFARRSKRNGLRLRMADGAGLVCCRMYDSFVAAVDGYTKNILAGHGDRAAFLVLSTLFHLCVFVFPWLWLAWGHGLAGLGGWPCWPLALIGMGIGVRALTAAATRQRSGDALTMPISVLVMTLIAANAIWCKARYGGPLWKGRRLHAAGSQRYEP